MTQRRGVATLWVILFIPVVVLMLAMVVDLGYLWLSRVELENSLESAALAAVKSWGDAGGGDTLPHRNVGVTFAGANTINGTPVVIGTNYDPNKPPNQNASCDGDLIFGAITTPDRPWVFNAGVRPGCALGEVLVDASSQGNLAADAAWGIAFRATDDPFINANLTITKIIIDVDPDNLDRAHFEGTFSYSDNAPQPAVHDDNQNSQPDNYGWYNTPPTNDPQIAPPTNQITHEFDGPSPSTGRPRRLILKFNAFATDQGFSPGDRFRFGANVLIANPSGKNFGEASGDEVGQIPAEVTIFFSLAGSPLTPVSDYLVDTGGRQKDCLDNNWVTDALGIMHLVVHPFEILDLPCPPNSSNNPDKNGQSYREIGGNDGRPFAVRAQKTVLLESLFCRFCGVLFGPYEISACATAMYDCEIRRPRLIRVRPENFICP
jgi:hypothetical protein